jgi:pimeloyl-ACP methyl ester carboxylesterase
LTRPIAFVLAATLVIACQKESPPSLVKSSGSKQPPASAAVPQSPVDLLTARKGFQTQAVPNSFTPAGEPAMPPAGVFEIVKYPSANGPLAAYLTPDPKDGKKHPVMIWGHGGFGGIGSPFWASAPKDNDQSASAFREAGLVLMAPSWRGENKNAGKFELFYGEVDDFLAAIDYAAKLPYVDPQRIYIGGHSTGGTLALLVAATGSTRFRAAFSFGGAPEVGRLVADGKGYGNTPFDYKKPEESRLRSAIYFTSFIKQPTFYFEGDHSQYLNDASRMRRQAMTLKVPFYAFGIRDSGHFNILYPLTHLIAQKILADTGPACNITIDSDDIDKAMSSAWQSAKPSPAAAPQGGGTASP